MNLQATCLCLLCCKKKCKQTCSLLLRPEKMSLMNVALPTVSLFVLFVFFSKGGLMPSLSPHTQFVVKLIDRQLNLSVLLSVLSASPVFHSFAEITLLSYSCSFSAGKLVLMYFIPPPPPEILQNNSTSVTDILYVFL